MIAMRFRLHTLMIILAIGPPLLAVGYWKWDRYRFIQGLREALKDSGKDTFANPPSYARLRDQQK
jgi:hypothetical protein